MDTECGIYDTRNGLWLTGINSDGDYIWGDESNAICFDSLEYQNEILADLGTDYARGRPKRER